MSVWLSGCGQGAPSAPAQSAAAVTDSVMAADAESAEVDAEASTAAGALVAPDARPSLGSALPAAVPVELPTGSNPALSSTAPEGIQPPAAPSVPLGASDRPDTPQISEELVVETGKEVTLPDGVEGPGTGPEFGQAELESDSTGRGGDNPKASYIYPPSNSWLDGSDPARSSSRPAYLSSRSTHIAGMTITRISDTAVFGVSNGKARHAYSRRQAWNADDSRILIGDKILDANTYAIQVNFVPTGSERNWSNLDPDVLFGIRFAPDPNHFVQYNVRTGETTTLRHFSEYKTCTIGDSEGNITDDDTRVVLVCSGGSRGIKEMISYDIPSDTILGRMPTASNFNWAGFSPLGTYIVVENNGSGNDAEELLRFDPSFNNRFKLTDDRNHGDFGIDENGDEVFVMISWDRMRYIRLRDGALVLLQISNGRDNFTGHGHISCRNILRPGWCYFSANTDTRVGAVRLAIADSSRVGTTYGGFPVYNGVAVWEPWGYHRSTQYNYNAQAKASVNRSGTRIVITSDWYSRGDIADYVLSYTQP